MNLFKNEQVRKGQPNQIDKYVGGRIKLRRSALGLSQRTLADLIGVTFQQIQKYESGENRVSSSRLYDFCHVLDVSADFFFEGINDVQDENSPRMLKLNPARHFFVSDNIKTLDRDPMKREESVKLVDAYYKIRNREVAKQLFDWIIEMSEKEDATIADLKKKNM